MTRYRHRSHKRDALEVALMSIGWLFVFTLPIYIETLVDFLLTL